MSFHTGSVTSKINRMQNFLSEAVKVFDLCWLLKVFSITVKNHSRTIVDVQERERYERVAYKLGSLRREEKTDDTRMIFHCPCCSVQRKVE